ncbi:DNA (cytosine-5-)-methyltransferase [Escherichia coli]
MAQLNGVGENRWSAAILKRALANDSAWHRLSEKEFAHLQTLLPKPPAHHPHYAFRFINLFAGIGGIRRGFESIGGQCVFTSEWNEHAVRTYKANHYCNPATHHFNEDIRDITLSHKDGVSDEAAAERIRQHIPEHDVLLAGFPCQPFSLAGVSKKNSLGRAHGFACDTQGTLSLMWCVLSTRVVRRFFARKCQKPEKPRPGKTFRIIMQTLDELGYDVADAEDNERHDPKIIDGKHSCRSTVNASCWWVFVAI